MNAHTCHCLQPKNLVKFDVNNPEHVSAIMKVIHGGRQHEELRFLVEPPFISATVMAVHKMALQYARQLTGERIDDTYTLNNSNIKLITDIYPDKLSNDLISNVFKLGGGSSQPYYIEQGSAAQPS